MTLTLKNKKMKRLSLGLAILAILFSACKNEKKEFSTHTVSGEQCSLLIFDEAIFDDVDTVGLSISYSLEWPDKGVVSPSTMRELQYLCFGDSTSSSVEEAARQWMKTVDDLDDEDAMTKKSVDSLSPDLQFYSYYNLESTCQEDSDVVVFTVKSESYRFGGAHGIYTVDFLTIDKETGDAIHLVDLVTDTNILCEAIARAIQDLDVNKDTRECLFDEFIGVDRMPLPRNFTIDSARNSIIVYYGLYEITCYACGIQEVVLPIFWLSKHVPLTPYAKRLFGPDSYIE